MRGGRRGRAAGAGTRAAVCTVCACTASHLAALTHAPQVVPLPVQEGDPLGVKVEALRVYLDQALGSDRFLQVRARWRRWAATGSSRCKPCGGAAQEQVPPGASPVAALRSDRFLQVQARWRCCAGTGSSRCEPSGGAGQQQVPPGASLVVAHLQNLQNPQNLKNPTTSGRAHRRLLRQSVRLSLKGAFYLQRSIYSPLHARRSEEFCVFVWGPAVAASTAVHSPVVAPSFLEQLLPRCVEPHTAWQQIQAQRRSSPLRPPKPVAGILQNLSLASFESSSYLHPPSPLPALSRCACRIRASSRLLHLRLRLQVYRRLESLTAEDDEHQVSLEFVRVLGEERLPYLALVHQLIVCEEQWEAGVVQSTAPLA
eukprot:362846-Chlamydomonas_euryale.AAC.3